VKSSIKNSRFGGTWSGWIGERSVATTDADGCSSAKSMAQMPVPVPKVLVLDFVSKSMFGHRPSNLNQAPYEDRAQ